MEILRKTHEFVANDVIASDTNGVFVCYISNDGKLWFWIGVHHWNDEDEIIPPGAKYQLANGVARVALGEQHFIFTLGQQVDANRSFTTNTLTLNSWAIDTEGVLQPGAQFSIIGTPPRHLSIQDGYLSGFLPVVGDYYVTIKGYDGINELTTTVHIRVNPPTTTPVFISANYNGTSFPVVFVSPAGHGVAAVSELMNFACNVGDPVSFSFEWDFIKPPFSFRIVGGALPPGLKLDGDTGNIHGVPSTSGEYTFVLSVKDWRGRGYQWIRLVIM